MTVRMARRVEDREPQVADLDGCPLLELVIDRAGLEVVVVRVDPGQLGDIQADRLLIAAAQAVGDHSGEVGRGLAQQLSHPGASTCMVAMRVCEDQVADARWIEPIAFDVLDDRGRSHAGTDVDQRQLAAPVY